MKALNVNMSELSGRDCQTWDKFLTVSKMHKRQTKTETFASPPGAARWVPPGCSPRQTSCPGSDARSSRGFSASYLPEACGRTCTAQLVCTAGTQRDTQQPDYPRTEMHHHRVQFPLRLENRVECMSTFLKYDQVSWNFAFSCKTGQLWLFKEKKINWEAWKRVILCNDVKVTSKHEQESFIDLPWFVLRNYHSEDYVFSF